MTTDSNINYLARVERHRQRFLRRQRGAQTTWRGYETGSFVPKLVRTARQMPLDEFVIEEIHEGAKI